MPIWEPRVHAQCDRCDEVTDPINLTMLAGGRSWDDRNVITRLKHMGWYINAEKTVCPECVETEIRGYWPVSDLSGSS